MNKQRLQIPKGLQRPATLSFSTKNKFGKNLLIIDYADSPIIKVHDLAYAMEFYFANLEVTVELGSSPKEEYLVTLHLNGDYKEYLEIYPKEIKDESEIRCFLKNTGKLKFSNDSEFVHLALRKIWADTGIPFTSKTADSLFIIEKECTLKLKKSKVSV